MTPFDDAYDDCLKDCWKGCSQLLSVMRAQRENPKAFLSSKSETEPFLPDETIWTDELIQGALRQCCEDCRKAKELSTRIVL